MTTAFPAPIPADRPPRTVAGVILAAGQSSRLGRPKQLLPLNGRPLLQHVVTAACDSALDEVVVVVGDRADEIRAALQIGRARIVLNTRFADGQSTSIHRGLDAVSEHVQGVLFLLGDQPGVTAALVDLLVARYHSGDAAIVAPHFLDGIGNPVLFDRALWPELRRIRGDTGAREMLRTRRADVRDVAIATPRLPDVDTWDDYVGAQRSTR